MALPAHAPIAVVVYVDERLCVDPRWGSKEVSGDLAGLRDARNGDYRIMVTIDDHKRVVWLRLVSHRTHLYRPRR